MRENEFNNHLLKNNFSRKTTNDEFNRGGVSKENGLGNEFNKNCYNAKEVKLAKNDKILILFKLVIAVIFCGIVGYAGFILQKPSEPIIGKTTEFNSLIITTENNFLNYQLDFVDENNYWQNFLVVLTRTDGVEVEVFIVEGEEKEKHATTFKASDLLKIEVYCDAEDNFGIEFSDLHNKTLIYKYVF